MAKEKIIEDQGYQVFPVNLALAKEYLKQTGEQQNEKNLNRIIQKLGSDKAESYTPSPYLGSNPSSRVSKTLVKQMGQPIHMDNGILAKRIKDKVELRNARIEIGGAVNHLTQIMMKHALEFKTTRKPNADLSNPKDLTDFEYVASGLGNNMSKEEREAYNKTVDVNRHIRILIQGYLYWTLAPILREDKKSIYKLFLNMGYKNISAKVLRNVKNTSEFIFNINKVFSFMFTQIDFHKFFGTLKWTKKGGLKNISSQKKK